MMKLTTIYIWSKKIHRWSMWFAIGLGVPLSLTGIVMEKSNLFEPILGLQTLVWGRSFHREISTKFVLALAVMIITGLLMWGIPELKKIKEKKIGERNEEEN